MSTITPSARGPWFRSFWQVAQLGNMLPPEIKKKVLHIPEKKVKLVSSMHITSTSSSRRAEEQRESTICKKKNMVWAMERGGRGWGLHTKPCFSKRYNNIRKKERNCTGSIHLLILFSFHSSLLLHQGSRFITECRLVKHDLPSWLFLRTFLSFMCLEIASTDKAQKPAMTSYNKNGSHTYIG